MKYNIQFIPIYSVKYKEHFVCARHWLYSEYCLQENAKENQR